uniref:Uncharacterized protein n=1 Tax=Cacopsylla melanoneura TaxID=428564 RepID=A0A8D8RGU2_9HEMI
MSGSNNNVADLKQLYNEIQLVREENRHLKQLLFENVNEKHKKDNQPRAVTRSVLHDEEGRCHQLVVPHTTCSDPSSCNSTQSLMSRSSGFDDPQHFSSENESHSTKPSASYKKRFMKKRLKDRDKKRSKSLDVETLLPCRVQHQCLHQDEPDEVERSNSIGARRLAPILTITVPSTEEIHQSELLMKDEKYLREQPRDIARTASIDMSVACSKPSDDRRMCHSAPSSPKKPINFLYDQGKSDLSEAGGDDVSQQSSNQQNKNTIHEIQKHYRSLQKRLSQEFSKKIGEWDMNRIRHPLASCRGLSLPGPGKEIVMSENLSPDFKKKLEEWNKMKCATDQIPPTPHTAPPHFKKLIPDWQKWKSMNFKHELFTSHDLASNQGPSRCEPEHLYSRSEHKTYRVSNPRGDKCTQNIAWIDKEIQKIEREKQRLEKEKEKCDKKIQRLEKMRLAIGSRIRMKEVLIPTSTGLLRFPGISRKFTQKLYEWEKAQGIGPEASTFALLDSSYQPNLKDRGKFKGYEKRTLTRSRSLGSVHDTTKGISRQPSSLSLNDMDELQDSSNVNDGEEELCSGDGEEYDINKNINPTSWTTDCLQTLQDLFFDLEELEEIECDFSTLKSNLVSNKEEMLQITEQLQEYLNDTDKLFNDNNNELKIKIRGLQRRKDDLFREEAEMQILYITYCNKMINLSEKQVSDSKYVKNISENILSLTNDHPSNSTYVPSASRSSRTEDDIAAFVSHKASQLIHYAKDIRDIMKLSEQKLYRNYSNAMESDSLQECIRSFNHSSSAMKTHIVQIKDYLIPYSPGYKEESSVFKFDNVPNSEDSMDDPMAEFLKDQGNNNQTHSKVPEIKFDSTSLSKPCLSESMRNSNEIDDKSSSDVSNNEMIDKKNSSTNLVRKQRKKLRRRRKSDLKRQLSFDKGDDDVHSDVQIMSTSDDEIARNTELKKKKDLDMSIKSNEKMDSNTNNKKTKDHEQRHVSLSDLVHLSDGSPILESKFKLNSVTTEPGKVCVPTVRKIFTPVVDDCNGNPHVVGYVLRSAVRTNDKQTTDKSKETEEPTKQTENVSKHLDSVSNSLEYIDKSDENDGDKIPTPFENVSITLTKELITLPFTRDKCNVTSPLPCEESKQMKAYKKCVESPSGENMKSDCLALNKDPSISKQNDPDKCENSKIKSIIEKYNKLTTTHSEESAPLNTTKVIKAPSNKIKELTEVFDTDTSSKHSSQEITISGREENVARISKKDESDGNESQGKAEESSTKLTLMKNDVLPNTLEHRAQVPQEKTVHSIPPHIRSEDYKNNRRHKTKLQLAKEQFLSNMACSSSDYTLHTIHTNTTTSTGDQDRTDMTDQPRMKQVQKSFSSGMINTLVSSNYGKLDKETAKSNESHVKPKKKTKSFREKFNTFRLKFCKPKMDKNYLGVGNSLDAGINDGSSHHSDVSARTSTHSIASNCSKSSGWRKLFDR